MDLEAREAPAILTIQDHRIGGRRHAEAQAAAIARADPAGWRICDRFGCRVGASNPQLADPLAAQLTAMRQPLKPVPHGRDASSVYLDDREDDCFAGLDRTGIPDGRQQA